MYLFLFQPELFPGLAKFFKNLQAMQVLPDVHKLHLFQKLRPVKFFPQTEIENDHMI